MAESQRGRREEEELDESKLVPPLQSKTLHRWMNVPSE